MDNIYGIELPSDALPVVTGKQFIICKTRGGELKFVTAAGSYNIVTSQNKYQVGAVVIRADNVSPASIEGGTWTKIAQSRAIIGASDAYPLGSTGGEREHIHDAGDIVAQIMGGGHYLQYATKRADEYAMEYSTNIPNGTENEISTIRNLGVPTIGSTAQSSNMQPYLALNIWQKISD